MIDEEKLKAIAWHYGRDVQTIKACEEFGEAAASASRLTVARVNESRAYESIADEVEQARAKLLDMQAKEIEAKINQRDRQQEGEQDEV